MISLIKFNDIMINNNNNNNNNNNDDDDDDDNNNNNDPVTLKYRVGVWQGIVVSHGQEGFFSLAWQCLEKKHWQ